MDDHFDICHVYEISKFDIARLACILLSLMESSGKSDPTGFTWSIIYFERIQIR